MATIRTVDGKKIDVEQISGYRYEPPQVEYKRVQRIRRPSKVVKDLLPERWIIITTLGEFLVGRTTYHYVAQVLSGE